MVKISSNVKDTENNSEDVKQNEDQPNTSHEQVQDDSNDSDLDELPDYSNWDLSSYSINTQTQIPNRIHSQYSSSELKANEKKEESDPKQENDKNNDEDLDSVPDYSTWNLSLDSSSNSTTIQKSNNSLSQQAQEREPNELHSNNIPKRSIQNISSSEYLNDTLEQKDIVTNENNNHNSNIQDIQNVNNESDDLFHVKNNASNIKLSSRTPPSEIQNTLTSKSKTKTRKQRASSSSPPFRLESHNDVGSSKQYFFPQDNQHFQISSEEEEEEDSDNVPDYSQWELPRRQDIRSSLSFPSETERNFNTKQKKKKKKKKRKPQSKKREMFSNTDEPFSSSSLVQSNPSQEDMIRSFGSVLSQSLKQSTREASSSLNRAPKSLSKRKNSRKNKIHWSGDHESDEYDSDEIDQISFDEWKRKQKQEPKHINYSRKTKIPKSSQDFRQSEDSLGKDINGFLKDVQHGQTPLEPSHSFYPKMSQEEHSKLLQWMFPLCFNEDQEFPLDEL